MNNFNRILFFAYVLFLSLFKNGFAQTKSVDSDIEIVRNNLYHEPLKSLNKLDEIINICKQTNYAKGLAQCYNLQGIIFFNRGLSDMALLSFIHSTKYYAQTDDTVGVAKVYNNLGVVSFSIKKYYYSIYFFQKSLAYLTKQDQYTNVIDIQNNIGSIYEKLKQYNTSMLIHRNSFNAAKKHNYHLGMASSLNNIAVIYENTKMLDSAEYFYNKSLEFADSIPKVQLSLTYSNLARTLLNLGKIDKVFLHLNSALKNATAADALSQKPEIYYLFSQYYEKIGNISQAYKYLQLNKEISEKLDNQTTEGDFADFIISVQQSQWLKEKELLDNQMKLQNRYQWLIIITVASILFILLLLFINIRNRNIVLNQKRALLENEKMRLKEDLQMKDRELTSMTMHIVTKNETLQEIKSHIDEISLTKKQEYELKIIKKIKSIIRLNADDEAVWKNYFYHFEQVYPGYLKTISETHKDLTQSENKLCAYILINLSNKEIAHVFSISETSVKVKKNRLAKKLGIESASELSSYLRRFVK